MKVLAQGADEHAIHSSSGKGGGDPSEVVIEDKTAVEQLRLIQQLEDEDRQTIFKLIDKMLTNKKFKDFF
ncbi:transcriptional regulator [Algoriphagus ratkowskyi]|uniref:transcriptional regulator n=1 Tax=Algoriphagus ratkowskyi TaxID=57028 RepID=UPI00146CFC43|nr:transcriptional regulator [Algoriphagus ratkowskyi]